MSQEAEVLFKIIKMTLGNGSDASLPDAVNWDGVYQLAIHQGVIALSWNEYMSQHSDKLGIDEELKYKWIGQQMVVLMINQKQWNAARELSALWTLNDIKAVVLKGISYAVLYPNPLFRRCCDLDGFLFDNWEKGNKAVEMDGFTVSRKYYKDSSFDFKGLHVENHRYCSPIRGGKMRKRYELFLRSLLSDGPLEKVGGTDFMSPPPLFNILFFLSHAKNHFLNEGGIQLRHVCDWGVLMKSYAQDTKESCCKREDMWNEVLERCKEFDLLKFMYSISQVARRVCGVDIPFSCPVNIQADNAMIEEIVSPTCVSVEFSKGWYTRYKLIKSTIQSRWKFEYYSEKSMIQSLFSSGMSFLFEKNPVLK